MFNIQQNQFQFRDKRIRKDFTANMCGDISFFEPLRREIAMATFRNRRGSWYARVLWYDNAGRKKEKQIPLRTKSKVTARERLLAVNRLESDIKDGLSFSFPWMNQGGTSKMIRFTIGNAIDEWMIRRQKNGIRAKTIEMNKMALKHFSRYFGINLPLESVTTNEIDGFIDYLGDKELSVTSINMYLRTIKSMFRYYWKRERLVKIPMIEQQPVIEQDPIYVTDIEFQAIMELEWLDSFYKRVFYFYRETGLRIREPFMSKLDCQWLDIPNLSKGKRPRSIELSESLRDIFNELINWNKTGYGSTITDSAHHISKVFKKSLRSIGADESKHFHSLRHTFAVRRIVENIPIYMIQKMMGHSSVTTTEIYARMELKRLSKDFPTLTPFVPKYGKVDTDMVDTSSFIPVFVDGNMPN